MVEVTLKSLPKRMYPVLSRVWGMSLKEATSQLCRYFGYAEDSEGLFVMSVERNSPAHKAGIRRGDLIEEVESKRVRSVEEFERIVNNLPPEQELLLLVNSRGKRHFVVLQP
jgi:serine protease Do